jgi:polyhydroxyalkanoate synthesis regulator phasin
MSETPQQPESPFQSRLAALQARVNATALALHERNVRPTVARIRAALGGGSPNELAPALRHWKDEILPTLAPQSNESGSRVPPQIADIVQELWTRATAAAVVELKGGSAARQSIARSEDVQSLREQVASLRDQLQRDAIAYGELRAQSARHEAIARATLGRVRDADDRERKLLHQLGEAKQNAAELTATIEQLRDRPRATASRRRPSHRRPAPKPARKAPAGGRSKPRQKPKAKRVSRRRSKPRKRR